MNNLGSSERALRVAIVGSGPSAFYAAEALFKSVTNVSVGMFEKLPTPFGLVRYGVAPDHQKIKNVTAVYRKTALNPSFEFYGNVEVGRDISVSQLQEYYDAVILAYGAETDRKLGIDGEDLKGSHTATEFVAWYNGHPLFQDRTFDLSCENAVVIGQGNVALDVARILSKTVDELKVSDISQKALKQLAESRIKQVHVIGRRGPAQAACTPSELREFMGLTDCSPQVDAFDLKLNDSSLRELENPANSQKKKNFEIFKLIKEIQISDKPRKLKFHFYKSPVHMYGDTSGRLETVDLEKNILEGEPGSQKARGSGVIEKIDCGILFRSVGYRGLPLNEVPYVERNGSIPHQFGRVITDNNEPISGLYTCGWIKRGPSGVIGTNKPDSEETVKSLLADIEDLKPCSKPDSALLINFLKEHQVQYLTYADWLKIDSVEIARGSETGKPREKILTVAEMLDIAKAQDEVVSQIKAID